MKATTRLQNVALALFAGTRVGNAFAALFNRYEGAQPVSPRRTWVPSFVRDARHDANSFTRWELSRKMRYFEANVWLIGRLKELHTKYTVGPHGLPVIPATSDTEWNARALECYGEWCESPCLDSLLPMGQLHRLMAGETHIDGEIFILKTRRKTAVQSVPAVQLIESHRVSSPGTEFSYSKNDDGIVDGAQVDKATGRTMGWWIRDGFEGDAWTYRPAESVIHVGIPDRVGMYRYITPYHASLNTMHDLADLEDYEMQRAKANAEEAKIITTPSGELPSADLRRAAFGGFGNGQPTADANAQMQAVIEQFKPIVGARTIALPTGSTISTPSNSSPSAATQWFWRLKMEQVASSVQIPMMLVLPESIQGTVARAILDDAHLSFRSHFGMYAIAAREMYRHYMQWAIYNDLRLVDPPADWNKCHVIPPRACNVDFGRNSTAMLAELYAGTQNFDTIFGANGSTTIVELTKKARNVGLIKQIAQQVSKEMGVEILPAEIAGSLADVLQKLGQASPDEPDDDDSGKGKGKPKELAEA